MNILNLIKSLFYICIGLCFLLLFSSNIENLLGTNDYFSWIWNINSFWLVDISVIFILIIYTVLKINNYKTDYPNISFTYLLLLSIVFYTYERFFSNYFEFNTFSLFDSLKPPFHLYYLDAIYWFALLHFVGYLKYLIPKTKNPPQKNTLLEDAPIHNNNEDYLDGLLKIPLDKIQKIIKENKFQNSFTIGLNGEWGDGKTSVFNMVKDNLKKEKNCIIVDFNPWMGFDKKVLVRDFFNSLSESLGTNFISEFSEYSNEILNNGEENIFIKNLQSIWQKKDESINSTFIKLNKKIGNLNKKIIVFIDDVDRLDKEEIFEILKLIRKTANFQNTFFVVAYDRNYVNNSIQEHSGMSVIKYLDKIINIEINLPYFNKIILKNYFIKHLKSLIPTILHYKVDHFMKSYEKDRLSIDLGFDENDLFLYWLNNFREIKKIINSIVINYNSIYKEVNFVDVIHLEILKLKHPKLYSYLFVKQNELLSVYRESYCYYLTSLDEVKASNKRFEKFLNKQKELNPNSSNKEELITVFDFYLDEYVIDNNINDIEKERIQDLINRLFIRWDSDDIWSFNVDANSEDELSVKYVNKFERYFSHTIFEINISEDEFGEFLSLDEENLSEKITFWINEGKLTDLSIRLSRKDNFKSGEEYKNTIIASLEVLKMNNGRLHDYQIIHKMIGRNFVPNFFEDMTSAKQFFIELFSSPKGSFLDKANILNKLWEKNNRRYNHDNGHPERFPLTDDEINSILKRFITDYINNGILFNNEFWSLYFMCQKLSATANKEPFEDVNQLIYTKLESDSMKILFLKSLVIYDGYGYQSIIRKGAIENLFGNFENFENNFLNTPNDDTYILKFREYYASSKNANWEYIDFEHDFIKESIHNK